MLICLSITQILGHIGTRSWMLTCITFMKKCSLWSNCIKYRRNVEWRTTILKDKAIWIFLLEVSLFENTKLINHGFRIWRYEHRQNFNVYIKKYNTETGYLTLTLDSRRRESEWKTMKFSSHARKKLCMSHDGLVKTISLPVFHL